MALFLARSRLGQVEVIRAWFRRTPAAIRLSGRHRGLRATLAVLLLVPLLASLLLHPDPSLRGTHRQLGLPGCLTSALLGIDHCPSCGLTTAFCHLMRGQIGQARAANPAAVVIFAAWVLMMIYAAGTAVSGRARPRQELAGLCVLAGAVAVWWPAALLL